MLKSMRLFILKYKLKKLANKDIKQNGVLNWSDSNQPKYYMYWCNRFKKIKVGTFYTSQVQGIIYFYSPNILYKFINVVGEDNAKLLCQ